MMKPEGTGIRFMLYARTDLQSIDAELNAKNNRKPIDIFQYYLWRIQ